MTSFGSTSWYTSTIQSGPSDFSANEAPPHHPRLQTSCPSSAHFVSPPFGPFLLSYVFGCSSIPPASSSFPDSLRVLQWNAGSPQARSAKLVFFISSHSLYFFCIQESNLNLFPFSRLPGYAALRSDRTHSRSGTLTFDDPHFSGGIIIIVWQGLSFSELSTSFLALFDPYSDFVGVNILPNNSFLLFFIDVCVPLIALERIAEPTRSAASFFPPPQISSF